MFSSIIKLFPSVTWKIKTNEKILFLTFDDGPVPEATPDVLDMLSANNAKATFFCIGENVVKHPEIFRRIKQEGHAIGNHTFNHLNGWNISKKKYLENVALCDKSLHDVQSFFRPPYGKLRPGQYSALKKKYKIVMWDVLTRDWERDRDADSCFNRILKRADSGSIVVFHDSIKARDRMLPALEMTLEHFVKSGFRFESLEKYS